jgi:hypothetical protein
MRKFIVLLLLVFVDIAIFFFMRNVESFWAMAAFVGFLWLTLAMVLKYVREYIEGSRVRSWIKRLIVTTAGIIETVAMICALIYCLQDVALFHPNSDSGSYQYLLSRPEYSKISFAGDGKIYNGVMKADNKAEPSPLIIMFIGNGQNAAQTMRAMGSAGMWESFLGYNCLIMDYPGYGLNAGRPSADSICKEALLAYDYASSLPYVDKNRIIIGGFSIGTGPAVYLAANREAAGLFLLAPFASAYDIYNSVLPIFHGPLCMLVKHKFLSDQYAP